MRETTHSNRIDRVFWYEWNSQHQNIESSFLSHAIVFEEWGFVFPTRLRSYYKAQPRTIEIVFKLEMLIV